MKHLQRLCKFELRGSILPAILATFRKIDSYNAERKNPKLPVRLG